MLSGDFPGGRPRWEPPGATFADNIEPYEQRKLWLLNGAHSLMAYAGSARGHETVAEAVVDDTCRAWMQQWWAEASRHLDLPAEVVDAYRDALLDRFANPRMRHRLAQIAADGSQKLPVRVLPVLRAERAAGRLPGGAARVLAAWICHLRGLGVPVDDVRADQMVAARGRRAARGGAGGCWRPWVRTSTRTTSCARLCLPARRSRRGRPGRRSGRDRAGDRPRAGVLTE